MMTRPLVILALLAAACGGDDGGPSDELPQSCLPECDGTREYDAQSYRLRARFDWDEQRLIASEEITLVLTSDANPVVWLDSEVEVGSVRGDDSALAFVEDSDVNLLRVDLNPMDPGVGDEVTFTIVYEAPVSDSLLANGARDDDPVAARVVFTDSEPDRGRRWLIANHFPADRATFGAELTVGDGEDVISNGERVRDDETADGRVVEYRIDDPIPTYMMAFAAGELVHTDRTTGRVPLAVWHRRGLTVDAETNLDIIAETMALFEDRLGPYPFGSYSVVLVPQYGGGMENATITFNNELLGQGNPSVSLHAHELGHHWYGDWVTMASYDDVWVKEGMATLLAAEAQRTRRDDQQLGRLMGTDFGFNPDDAVVDTELTGLSKYTSGPYERAAWNMTQIRRRIGDEAFWAGARRALEDHAMGAIDGESFLRSFAPALDDDAIEQVLAALQDKGAPSITIGATPVAGGTDLSLIVGDPDRMLLAPIEVTVVDAAGAATSHTLEAGTPLVVLVPTGGYVAPDEADVHPYWTSSFDVVQEHFDLGLLPLLGPPAAGPAVATFTSRSAAHQERALTLGFTAATSPADFAAFYAGLDSSIARREAVLDACFALSNLPEGAEADAWRTALGPLVRAPALPGFTSRYGRCGVALAEAELGAEMPDLVADPSPAAQLRLEYLIAFDYGAEASRIRIGAIAIGAPSLRLRDRALERLSLQTAGGSYTPIPDGEREAWRTFFRDRLDDVTSSTRFRLVWRGVLNLADTAALPRVGELLHSVPLSSFTQRDTICGAFAITQGDASWTAFQDAAQPWDTLSEAAAEVLADPAVCAE